MLNTYIVHADGKLDVISISDLDRCKFVTFVELSLNI